jgi:hypothetical protein
MTSEDWETSCVYNNELYIMYISDSTVITCSPEL